MSVRAVLSRTSVRGMLRHAPMIVLGVVGFVLAYAVVLAGRWLGLEE